MERKIKLPLSFFLDRGIDDIRLLEEKLNPSEPNFFEISGMVTKEIKHSKVLSWILNPNANHGLGDSVIKRLIIATLQTYENHTQSPFKLLDAYSANYYSLEVFTERREIDISLISKESKFIIAIENKIWSGEHNDQLNKYRDRIQREFKDYKKLLLYLTPMHNNPSDEVNWIPASYQMIDEAIEKTLKNTSEVKPSTKKILNDYLSLIRRHIIMDEEMKKLAKKIYLDHKDALDFIYETVQMTSHTDELFAFLKNWLSETASQHAFIHFDPEFSTSKLLRFTTDNSLKIAPRNVDSKAFGWKNGYAFMYELRIYGNWIDVIGTISDTKQQEIKPFIDNFLVNYNQYDLNKGPKWKLPETWLIAWREKILNLNFELNELDEYKEELSTKLGEVIFKKIPEFEISVMKYYKAEQLPNKESENHDAS